MEGQWEKNLPKIPVPNLKDTLDRYLAHLKVVIPSSQYEQTRKTVDNFESTGIADKLQKLLTELAEKSENWANQFWYDEMYLNNPLPLPVNSSPFCLFPKQNFRSTLDVLRYSARIVAFTLQFKEQIDKESLSQDYGTGLAKGQPLCMQTYRNFFGATRIPGKDKDHLIFNETTHENHIIVASRNQFYKVNLGKGYQVNEDHLVDQLKLILYSSKELESTSPLIGLLTCENRRTWATIRAHLIEKPKNKESIEALETCLFVLCLDDSVFGKSSSIASTRRDSVEMARMETSFMSSQLMHGGGTEFYSANRYYDKFLQIIVSRDGLAGIVFEHSASEGITLIRYADSLLDYLESNPITPLNDISRKESLKRTASNCKNSSAHLSSKDVQRLTWDVDCVVVSAIKEAAKRINKLIHDVDLVDLNFTIFGKKFIIDQSMSPDAFIQLSLQLTYYKVHRRLVSTYESASLRKYRLGRVDNIRSNTIEVLAWVRALCDEIPNLTDQQKLDLFQLAIKKQVEIAKYTIDGYGPDNHLYALQGLAKVHNFEIPLIFREKSYKEHLNFKLSTSQLVYRKLILVGYGAVTPEGYGCAYRLTDNTITFCITSFFSSPETGSNYFASSLEGSLLQMRELCLKLKAKATSKESTEVKQCNQSTDLDNTIKLKMNGDKSPIKADINDLNQETQLISKDEIKIDNEVKKCEIVNDCSHNNTINCTLAKSNNETSENGSIIGEPETETIEIKLEIVDNNHIEISSSDMKTNDSETDCKNKVQ
ncbi:choline O-acetyltransferase-like [Tetranychus urticae]|uniref:choline O-acetyltransferase-like n=1 Tax=Tetranychus urticae TaxID=32264 RepID=UPI00077C0CEE|nr:choline O-acetyltransferase-like [Tetranychus urticae]